MAQRPLLPRVMESYVQLRLSDGAEDIFIMPAEGIDLLAGESAVQAFESAVEADKDVGSVIAKIAERLRNDYDTVSGTGHAARRRAEKTDAFTAVKMALAEGALVALKHAQCAAITATEMDRIQHRPTAPAPPPNPPAPKPPDELHKYSICVVNDMGDPVSNVQLKLEIEGTPRMASTGGDGRATVEWYSNASATVRVLNQDEIEKALEGKFTKPVSSSLPAGGIRLPIGNPFVEGKAPADSETTIVIARPGTYVVIELIDEDKKAVAGARYEVLCSDGTAIPGTLDDQGRARVDGIPFGPCKVGFPDFHDADWGPQ